MTQRMLLENIENGLAGEELLDKSVNQLLLEGISVFCNDPNKDIYDFGGALKTSSADCEIDLLQFAPRGAFLRNSQPVVAMVLYTGKDTKLVLN
jgi:hypothetical protein